MIDADISKLRKLFFVLLIDAFLKGLVIAYGYVNGTQLELGVVLLVTPIFIISILSGGVVFFWIKERISVKLLYSFLTILLSLVITRIMGLFI